MATTRNDITMRITADSRGVATGLAPMMTSLDKAQAAAAETEAALDSIGTTPITLSVHDEAIQNARAEIARLREEMANQLRLDPQADTRQAEKRISQLRRQIKELDREKPVIDVEVDTTHVDRFVTSFTALYDVVSGARGIGGAGLGAGLAGAARGLGAVGGEAAAAVPPLAAVGGTMLIAAGAAVKLGSSAADAETSIAQLDALTKGLGAETFKDLQDFAAATPFEVDEVTAATKRLVAAGVPLKDIPDNIHDLGEVAAATGVPIEQISTVFAQMVSKGKASYEELQQLAEAGIPVWQTLADALGMSVAQVQELATQGKLNADAIALVREELAQTYSGAMQRQAETFNGRMSTLNDTFDQIGQSVGTVFLPAMKDVLDVLQRLADPLLTAANWVRDLNQQMEDSSGLNLVDSLGLGWIALDVLNGGLKDTEEQLDDTGDAAIRIGHLIPDVLAHIAAESADAEKKAQELKDAFESAVDAFQGIGAPVRARVDFIISQDDLEDEIRKTVKGTKDDKPIQLPADLKIGQIGGLTDKQQGLVSNLSAWVEQGLEEGARQAQIDPTFDADDFYRNLRRDLKPIVLSAGIDESEVNRFMTNVLNVPAPWKVKPELTNFGAAQAQMQDYFPDRTLTITPTIGTEGIRELEDRYGIDLGGGAVSDDLTATIDTEVDSVSLNTATGQLDDLSKDRVVNFYINPLPGGAGDFTLGTGGSGSSGGAPPPRLPPNVEGSANRTSTPQRDKFSVDVYLDGRFIGEGAARRRRRGLGRRVA